MIGSGAGGAVVAARAAEAGRTVALLEEGAYVAGDAVVYDQHRMVAAPYKEHGLQTTVDLGMTILQGRALGGTTHVNNAICFRIDDPGLLSGRGEGVMEEWRGLGCAIDEAGLRASYDRVEAELGVARIPDPLVGASGHALLDGWRAIDPRRPRSGVFRKNIRNCIGCGYCNYACPYGHKASTLETYVRAAGERGAHVIPECKVERLVRRDETVAAVEARLRDGTPITVEAGAVVVAAGAIGSSVLLMRSGLRRNVGTRFSFNAATPVLGRYDEPRHSWAADQMTAYVDGGDFLVESSFDPPMSVAVAMPGWAGEHLRRMDAYDHLARFGVLLGTRADGRVKRTAFFRDTFGPVAWGMGADDLATMKRGIALAARIHFAAGVAEVYVASFLDCRLDAGDVVRRGVPDADAIAAARRRGRAPTRPKSCSLLAPAGRQPDERRPAASASSARTSACTGRGTCSSRTRASSPRRSTSTRSSRSWPWPAWRGSTASRRPHEDPHRRFGGPRLVARPRIGGLRAAAVHARRRSRRRAAAARPSSTGW